MIHIPSSEILKPGLHADTLGYTFVWHGHFLRGIIPQSVELCRSYFESGFLDDITGKGLFPKTWVTDYENEQFGIILEHDFITPVLYATEWNSMMLRDAALMVIKIAEIAWHYGYNMVDCHKLNVLFKNNKPIYVDLGSFIPKGTGVSSWHPYPSFLRSYYYILDVWKDGASQIAKRMMAPGNEMNQKDYLLYKHPLYRCVPRLLKLNEVLSLGYFSILDLDNVSYNKKLAQIPIILRVFFLIACGSLRRLKLHPAQNFGRLLKRINAIQINTVRREVENNFSVSNSVVRLLQQKYFDACSAMIIDCRNPSLYDAIVQNTNICTIISINQDESCSNSEYELLQGNTNVICTHYKLLNNSINMKGKYPEDRLCSDVVIIPNFKLGSKQFDIDNACVFFDYCSAYSKDKSVIVHLDGFELGNDDEVTRTLKGKLRFPITLV